MTTSTTPAPAALTAAREVAPAIKARAGEADRQRVLHQETMDDLRRAGLIAMTLPASCGGGAVDLLAQTQVYETLAGACASTAWCLGNHSGMLPFVRGAMAPVAADPLLAEVVQDGPFLAHATVPAGQPVPVDGGYRLSGRWPFISGSLRARWALLSTLVEGPPPDWPADADAPPPVHNRWMLVRLDDPKVTIEETWQAMAVRASMSHDVVVDGAFVPHDEAVFVPSPPDFARTMGREGDPPGTRLPLIGLFSFASAISIGIAQAAIDETLEYAGASSMIVGGNPSGSLRGHMPGNQFALADAMIANASGRAYLHQQIAAIAAHAAAAQPATFDDVVNLLMAMVHSRESAHRAVDLLFAVRGAHGLFETGSFERYYRDVRMPLLHGAIAPDFIREQVAKYALNIPPDREPRWG